MEDIFDKILAKIRELSIRYKYVILCIFAISIGIYVIDYIRQEEESKIDLSEYYVEESNNENISENIIVHIDGGVANPGVYEMDSNSRVNDVIEKAGGLLPEAITKNINLARQINDGEKIYIYVEGEEENIQEEIVNQSSGKVNINNATKDELTSLPGIGDSTANKILEYIKEKGKFKKIEDIQNVSGIGQSKYESIKDLIDVK